MERLREVIDLTLDDEEPRTPGIPAGLVTLVPIEEPTPVASGTLEITLGILQYIELTQQTG